MYYLIYKIRNIVNGKEYIGAHQTLDKDDGYMGSGKYLKRAIEKYGKDNFTREILFEFDNKQDMFAKEAELVTEEYLSESNTYNIRVGGKGGFYNVSAEVEQKRTLALSKYQQRLLDKRERDPIFNQLYIEDLSRRGKQARQNKVLKRQTDSEFDRRCTEITKQAREAANSEVAIQKRKSTYAKIGHAQGNKNSQFGKMWIYNIETQESKSIMKTDRIPDGWDKGRKMSKEKLSREDIEKGFLQLTQDVAMQQGYSKDYFNNYDRGKLLENIDDDPTRIDDPSKVGEILNAYKQDTE